MRGRVQGVGFRWWCQSQAQRLGLRGFVRNCADGTVDVQVRGPADAVSEIEQLLHEGPPSAVVEQVDPISPATAAAAGFEIRY